MARKMVLIPEDSINKLKKEEEDGATVQTSGNNLSRLDKQLFEILNSKKNDFDKWTEYKDVLRRFLFFSNENENKQHPTQQDEPVIEETKFSEERILTAIPKIYQKKARGLINHISASDVSHRLVWDALGRVTIDGKLIENSHIIDLINDAMRQRQNKPANGREAFAQYLYELNTPKTYIGNQSFFEDTILEKSIQPDTTPEYHSTPHPQKTNSSKKKKKGKKLDFSDSFGVNTRSQLKKWENLNKK